MELLLLLKNGTLKKYKIKDVRVMEQYAGRNNRWNETAIIFKDNSVLWEGGSFMTYVIDGEEFITDSRVNTGGGCITTELENKLIDIVDIENYHDFVKEIKEQLSLVECEGTYDDEYHSFIWENSSS